jgi:hypothetical protein
MATVADKVRIQRLQTNPSQKVLAENLNKQPAVPQVLPEGNSKADATKRQRLLQQAESEKPSNKEDLRRQQAVADEQKRLEQERKQLEEERRRIEEEKRQKEERKKLKEQEKLQKEQEEAKRRAAEQQKIEDEKKRLAEEKRKLEEEKRVISVLHVYSLAHICLKTDRQRE